MSTQSESSSFSPRVLLSTSKATARVITEDQIEFVCEASTIIGLFRFLGGLCLGGALIQWTAALFSQKGSILFVTGSLLMLLGLILLKLATWQKRGHGRFVLDRRTGQLSQFHGPTLVHQVPLSSIQKIFAVTDYGDGMRPDILPELPRWLVCHAQGTHELRLGKGSAKELEPTLKLLTAWQLPVRTEP